MIKNEIVARKYATSFFNIFNEKIDENLLENIKDAIEILSKNKDILFFFSLPYLSINEKNQIIDLFLKKLKLPGFFKKLITLLVNHNRMNLFKEILQIIYLIYQEKKEIMFVNVSSAIELKSEEKDIIKNFLTQNLQKKIILDFKIDKNLIAGIKLKSNTVLWEYSIAGHLYNLKKEMLAG